MAAQKTMSLTRLEREAITDSVLKIQSIQTSLEEVDEAKIPDREGIENCLESADKTLRKVLTESGSGKKRSS